MASTRQHETAKGTEERGHRALPDSSQVSKFTQVFPLSMEPVPNIFLYRPQYDINRSIGVAQRRTWDWERPHAGPPVSPPPLSFPLLPEDKSARDVWSDLIKNTSSQYLTLFFIYPTL